MSRHLGAMPLFVGCMQQWLTTESFCSGKFWPKNIFFCSLRLPWHFPVFPLPILLGWHHAPYRDFTWGLVPLTTNRCLLLALTLNEFCFASFHFWMFDWIKPEAHKRFADKSQEHYFVSFWQCLRAMRNVAYMQKMSAWGSYQAHFTTNSDATTQTDDEISLSWWRGTQVMAF